MIKLLYITDTHFRGVPPVGRTDDFLVSIKTKLAEVAQIGKEENVDALIHGGDLFDTPEPGLGFAGELLSTLMSGLQVPMYAVPGNHDLYGHNQGSLPRTLLGLLSQLGFIRPLGREPVFIEKDGLVVQLTGQGYHADIDRRDWRHDYVVRKDSRATYAVHVVHGSVIPVSAAVTLPFISNITIAEEVAEATQADLTLVGHWHYPFEVCERGRWIVNPGAMVRLSATQAEMERTPQVVLVRITDQGVTHECRPLATAKPGIEILSRAHIETAQSQERARDAFLARLDAFRTGMYHTLDPAETLRRSLAQVDADSEVEAEAWRRYQGHRSLG